MKAQQLKNSILQMAVQGKLVPQDPNDEPASVLIERIRVEKQRLIKEGKIKKDKNESVIYRAPKDGSEATDNLPYRFFERAADGTERDITDELPFDIPESWEWARLNSVVNEVATGPFGSMLHKTDYVRNGIPLVNPQNIIGGEIQPNDSTTVSSETAKRLNSYSLNKNDVVIARRGEMGRCAVVEEMQSGWLCGTGSFILRANLYMFSSFLVTVLRSWHIVQYLRGSSIGTTMSNLNHGILNHLLIPVPPLSEQHNIVERFEQLLPSITAYDTAEQKLTTLNATFPDQLKKSILQAAVQGRLVEQDPSDEPASVLLERIRIERERLILTGKIKRNENENVIFRRDNSHYEMRDG